VVLVPIQPPDLANERSALAVAQNEPHFEALLDDSDYLAVQLP
jgi:hypothetical protein